MFINPELTALYFKLDVNQRQKLVLEICLYVGLSQRVVQDKIKSKWKFNSKAEIESFEKKFVEVYQQVSEPVAA